MQESKQEPNGVSVHAGFPNPATDKALDGLDLNQLLIQNTTSTFVFRLRGSEWERFGIFDGDVAVIDRALSARKTDLVIWWNEHVDSFAISKHKDIPADAHVWGVVTAIVHQFRKSET